MCSHREPAYADLPLRHPLPNSERRRIDCILLPLFATLSRAELASVAQALREACLPVSQPGSATRRSCDRPR